MSYLAFVSVLIAIIGLAFAATGIRRLFQRRFLKAAGLELSGLVFILLASSSFLLASNLHTYQRLTFEQEVEDTDWSNYAVSTQVQHRDILVGEPDNLNQISGIKKVG